MPEAARVDQRLARVAHDILPPVVSRELRTRMRQLPARLRGSGLAASYAFIMTRAEDDPEDALASAYHRLAGSIAKHVADQRLLEDLAANPSQQDFMKALAGADARRYARVSAEIDALAVWLSRLADAYCEERGKEERDDRR